MIPTFGCIYKTGGDYTMVDVLRLKHNVERRTSVPYNFVCFTDDINLLPTSAMEDGRIDVVEVLDHWARPLLQNNPGWWSVPEVFRLTGPVVVTGLDTVFVGSVDPFFELAETCTPEQFYMIHAFKRSEVWASGFMVWNGDWSWLFNEFNYKEDSREFVGEQRYTRTRLLERGVAIQGVQDAIDGIYSYKHHVRGKGLPEDARAILFHGRPRPSHVREQWVRQEWR